MADRPQALPARIRDHVRARAEQLWAVSLALHDDPELAFQEHHAADLLSGALDEAGFAVTRPVAEMPTAFVARAGSGQGPRVALLLEYDALPGLGHACGHNLIAAAGLGAGLALHDALPRIEGTLMVVGTPAEESGGGKVAAVRAGLFDGVDAALMFHPGVHDWAWAPLTASARVRIGFHGRAAHPTGNPTEGIDALAALIELFNTLSVLDRRRPAGSHVQGIVTQGGTATNIVPDYAEGLFGLRGATTAELRRGVEQLDECARGIARATGTTVEVVDAGTGYQHFRDNAVLSERFAGHLARTGITLTEPAPGVYLGSSDIGDVSTRVPALHPFVAIMDSTGSDHTTEFAVAAASPRARTVMLAAAEALACTAADVLHDGTLRDGAWELWRQKADAGL
ncbi:amidohydrolase [Streptomyces sp. NPDC006733]|uniref:amidohydrolase n=1 Tax=Streptomyces sp. NPDC006733 TaxID=3155460 RepID=UPI0033F0F946